MDEKMEALRNLPKSSWQVSGRAGIQINTSQWGTMFCIPAQVDLWYFWPGMSWWIWSILSSDVLLLFNHSLTFRVLLCWLGLVNPALSIFSGGKRSLSTYPPDTQASLCSREKSSLSLPLGFCTNCSFAWNILLLPYPHSTNHPFSVPALTSSVSSEWRLCWFHGNHHRHPYVSLICHLLLLSS